VDDAAVIGNEYLVVPYLDAEFRKTTDDYKKIAARLNTAATICKSNGLKFAYHNHAFEFDKIGDTNGYNILLKETDASMVKMELDLFWVKNAGYDPIAMFNANPGRFVMWHVKDMDKNNKDKQTEIGNGSIDFKAIFKAQKKSGLEYFFVEQENYDISPYDSVEKNIKYVKANLI
jgi:sugar phosphate isomerase/epimerase